MERNQIKVGQEVLYGRPNGQMTRGRIQKLNPKKAKVEQLEQRGTQRAHPVGTVWGVPYSMIHPASGVVVAPAKPKVKRPDAEIMRDIVGCWRKYSRLSPENLCCDGLISMTAARRKGRVIRGELRTLQAELGRKVTESQAYNWEDQNR